MKKLLVMLGFAFIFNFSIYAKNVEDEMAKGNFYELIFKGDEKAYYEELRYYAEDCDKFLNWMNRYKYIMNEKSKEYFIDFPTFTDNNQPTLVQYVGACLTLDKLIEKEDAFKNKNEIARLMLSMNITKDGFSDKNGIESEEVKIVRAVLNGEFNFDKAFKKRPQRSLKDFVKYLK
ncbi:MAG: hypothetical protein LBQ13_01285 [Endomicrobium sp.]|jgi:hypothetical protein|nr:hypothetical protein [Endomicrobium sp.]